MGVVVRGRRQQGLSHPQSTTKKEDPRYKLEIRKSLLAAQLQNNIQDVHPHACCLPRSALPQGKHCQDKQDSTNPNVATAAQEVHKHEANQQQQHMQVKLQETPACPVVTYLSIVSVFSLVMLTNFQHSPTLHPQTR